MTKAMRRFVLGAVTLAIGAALFALAALTIRPGARSAAPASAITFMLLLSAILFNAVTIVVWTSTMRSPRHEHARVLAGMIAATSIVAVAFFLLAA